MRFMLVEGNVAVAVFLEFCENKKRLKQQMGAFRLGGEENHNDPI